jgi:DNA processing protein
MERSELDAWLRLTLTPGVGNHTVRRLLALCGLPEQVFQQPALWHGHVTAAQARALSGEPEGLAALAETTWQWLHGAADGVGRRVLTLADAAYPALLLATEDPPPLLYVMGPEQVLDRPLFFPDPCLAVVGSRSPTAQGALHARQFAKALREAGLCIVSGMALGVDAAAHEGALEDVPEGCLATIAVVGTGLDRVYPSRHRALAHRIARQGLLVSEYPLGTPPLAANFPKRNRIIAGLSQGTLVVEAALQSGSLITARLAAEQGREVFAIPGSIQSPQARGCHALIRQGAKLVETIQDVLEELQLQVPAAVALPTAATEAPQSDEPLLSAMGWDPIGLDALIARTGMDAPALQVALLEYELAGRVARLPGGSFQRMALS